MIKAPLPPIGGLRLQRRSIPHWTVGTGNYFAFCPTLVGLKTHPPPPVRLSDIRCVLDVQDRNGLPEWRLACRRNGGKSDNQMNRYIVAAGRDAQYIAEVLFSPRPDCSDFDRVRVYVDYGRRVEETVEGDRLAWKLGTVVSKKSF
ncbi:hypothetical protein AWENTII_002392 [Aspergillus wentii]|nr:hypothetical protein MW887_008017 [Aspergillus wentii]